MSERRLRVHAYIPDSFTQLAAFAQRLSRRSRDWRISASSPLSAASSSPLTGMGDVTLSSSELEDEGETSTLDKMLASAPMIPTPATITKAAVTRPPAVTGYLSP